MKSKWIGVVLVAALVLGGLCYLYFRADLSPNETARLVERIEDDAKEFTRTTIEHRTVTEGKVVIIREQVVSNIRALDPDGLALAALAEIELFRRGAGGGTDSSAAGLDGQ